MTPSEEWSLLDCDNDGNSNGTDPNPLIATAVDDSGTTLPLTEIVINILANDDYLPNNDPNNLGITSITRIGGDATGVVSFDPETGELSYTPSESENETNVTIIYEVCNTNPDPDVCASATVTIFVTDNPIDAVDDDFSELLADGTTGGVVDGGNIFDNDTLNGMALDPTDVTLTSTPTGPLTINPDGTVSVAPETVPGTYTIDYTICEIANPINCDTATVTVEVIIVTIDAVDDDYSDIFIDGEDGGVLPDSNVLDNDTLNGLAVDPDDVTITSTPTGPLTVNIDGIAGVELYGGREKSIEIRLNEEACKANRISINSVRSAISSNNKDKTFAGKVIDGDRRLFVNVSAEYTDVTEIGNIIIKQDGPILIKDVAEIFYGVKEEESYSRINGLEAVTISLVYDNQANMIDLSHATLDVIDRENNGGFGIV